MGRKVAYLIFVAVVLGACGASWGQKKASSPNPANGATDVIAPLLRWTAGSTALFHNVYLGTTPDLGPAQLVGARQVPPMFYYAAGFQAGTTYYWRVDEIEKDGVTVIPGDVWTFLAQPLTAFWPDPADGSNAGPVAPDLKWLAGQGALKHHVYFGDSRAAVTAGAADVDKGVVNEPNYAPGELQPTTTYFWRVDEVGAGGKEVAGDVWSFTTVFPVDDFESYNDEDGKGTRIYETWIDGYSDASSGSTVGNLNPPFAEQTIVRSGKQSMPMDYNNVNAPFFSEAKREFAPAEDWTANDVNTLTLHVRGREVDFEILSVSKPPVIDGQVDDVWAQATVLPIKTKIDGADLTGPADASGQFRELYDATYLYVLVDINDEKLYNDSSSAYLDDSVEVYVDGDNTKKGAGLDGNNRQYTFGWTATDIQGTNTNITGVEFAQVNTPTGWRIEIKLPWQSLMGTGAPVGKLIGVDCFYNDDDDGGDTRESQIAWHSTVGGDWQTPSSWGTALVAKPATGGADLVYVALQDSANHTGVVSNPDPALVKAAQWVEWQIPLSDFANAGVNLAKVRWMYVGVGDRANPVAGGTGKLFIDDIYLTKPAPAQE